MTLTGPALDSQPPVAATSTTAARLLTVIGRRSLPAAIAARALLDHNGVAHRWIDLDTDPLAPMLRGEDVADGRLPLVILPDGSRLEAPEGYIEPVPGAVDLAHADRYMASADWRTELCRGAGLPTSPRRAFYDVVVVGAGPAA